MDEHNRPGFADRLAELRAAQGLSYDAIGAKVGISGETIRRYEMGSSAPRNRRIVSRLEGAVDARPGELWALLTGGRPPDAGDDDDTDQLVRGLLIELRELREAIAELERRQRDEHRGSPRGRRAVGLSARAS